MKIGMTGNHNLPCMLYYRPEANAGCRDTFVKWKSKLHVMCMLIAHLQDPQRLVVSFLPNRELLQKFLQGGLPMHRAPGQVLCRELPRLRGSHERGCILQQVELGLHQRKVQSPLPIHSPCRVRLLIHTCRKAF